MLQQIEKHIRPEICTVHNDSTHADKLYMLLDSATAAHHAEYAAMLISITNTYADYTAWSGVMLKILPRLNLAELDYAIVTWYQVWLPNTVASLRFKYPNLCSDWYITHMPFRKSLERKGRVLTVRMARHHVPLFRFRVRPVRSVVRRMRILQMLHVGEMVPVDVPLFPVVKRMRFRVHPVV